jgi:general secretion pathway protein G
MKLSRTNPASWNGRLIARSRQSGFTLVEMIAVITILLILMGAAVPVMKVTVKRQREVDLHRALWEMRSAIDRYKDAADKNAFQVKLGTEGYPPDLDTLVNGVEIAGGKKLRFLRRIPVDPMTGNTDWGLRSMQDDPQSDSWGGQNVFDVYTKSTGTGLNGTKYKDW